MKTVSEFKNQLGSIALTQLDGIGIQTAKKIANNFNHPEELFLLTDNLKLGQPAEKLFEQWDNAIKKAKLLIEKSAESNIRILTIWDDDYPNLLAMIDDYPFLLHVKGELSNKITVACVGTREPSKFGIEVSKSITGFLAKNGCSIISGLAYGVDTLAHETALKYNSHTVAVLAHGLDIVYPSVNKKLAYRIVDNGGALVSEKLIGTSLHPYALFERDRIQSGMSLGTVMMQASLKSGTMHTARYTIMQGRLLFSPVPPKESQRLDVNNAGNIVMTSLSGADVANNVDADWLYREQLLNRFKEMPPAFKITSKDDYDIVLKQLEEVYEEQN